MKTRAAKFVAAIIASILYSASAFAAPDDAEPAEPRADTCLTSPRDYTPPGTRWRYRLERDSGRRCWFLKDEEKPTARSSEQKSSEQKPSDQKAAEQNAAAEDESAPAPTPRRKTAATRTTISDARAELSQSPAEPARHAAVRRAADPAAAALVAESSQPSGARSVNMLAPNTATRWPAPMSATAQTTAQANTAATPQAPAAEPSADARQTPTTMPPAKPQVMPRAVPPMPASEKPMSTPMLVTIVAGGLSVFGVLMSLLFAWLAQRKAERSPNPSMMPPLEMSRRPGDAYRQRKRLRAQKSGRRAA